MKKHIIKGLFRISFVVRIIGSNDFFWDFLCLDGIDYPFIAIQMI